MTEYRRSGEPHNFEAELGPNIQLSVRTILGGKQAFPDGSGELAILTDNLQDVKQVTLDRVAIDSVIDERLSPIIHHAVRRRLDYHKNQLMRQNLVMVGSDDENSAAKWSVVDSQHVSCLLEPLQSMIEGSQDLAEQLQSKYADTDDLPNQAYNIFRANIASLAASSAELIPKPERPPVPPSRLRKIARQVFKVAEVEYLPYPNGADSVEPAVSRKLTKRLRRLNLTIENFLDDPTTTLATLALDGRAEEIAQEVCVELDRLIASSNSGRIETLAPVKRAHYQPVELDQEPVDVDEVAPPVESDNNSEVIGSTQDTEIISDLGTFEAVLPWLGTGSTEVNLNKISFGSLSVLCVRAIPPKIADTVANVRSKAEKTDGTLNDYDQTILQISKRIAHGVMPWQSTSSVKRVQSRNTATGQNFSDTIVWYSTDIKPNAPRVYFTVQALSDLTVDSMLPLGTKPDDQCVVIIAETDKANQLEVLKYITGQSRKSLRKGGAGSV